jgi:hypothetical protein
MGVLYDPKAYSQQSAVVEVKFIVGNAKSRQDRGRENTLTAC